MADPGPNVYHVNEPNSYNTAFGAGESDLGAGNDNQARSSQPFPDDEEQFTEELEKMGISRASLAEIKEADERQRRKIRKQLTTLKKHWRKEEAAKQRKLDQNVAEFKAAGFPVGEMKVRKRELPWWLSEAYDIPSNSEDEAEYEAKEKERRKNPPKVAPNGPEIYSKWIYMMESLSDEDLRGGVNPAYLSDDDDDMTYVDLDALNKPPAQTTHYPENDLPDSVKEIMSGLVGENRAPVPTENARRLFLESTYARKRPEREEGKPDQETRANQGTKLKQDTIKPKQFRDETKQALPDEEEVSGLGLKAFEQTGARPKVFTKTAVWREPKVPEKGYEGDSEDDVVGGLGLI